MIKIMQNLRPNKRNLKFERETNPAVVKTLFSRINVEDELCLRLLLLLLCLIVIIIGSRQTYVAS
jgi:hypothetical protein